jgi:myo-inositol-1(or 4)-monophosphatase
VFPDDAMLGEEDGITPGWNGTAPLWVVDPIDGTANFARRLPLWCISIGLYADGAPVLGVIHNPMTDELHAAARGRGATLNGVPIRASAVASPRHARINLGFSYRRDPKLHVASIERTSAGSATVSPRVSMRRVICERSLNSAEPSVRCAGPSTRTIAPGSASTSRMSER